MRITKMHALGNNYVYINQFDQKMNQSDMPRLAVLVSDVRRGIGSDGMITIGPSERAPIRMRIFNADGSEAETCGNGLRCVAKYAYERKLVEEREFSIETNAGIVRAHVQPDDMGRVHLVTIDMGLPKFGANAVHFAGPETLLDASREHATVSLIQGEFVGSLVSMGNPHFVTRVLDAKEAPLVDVGPQIETHPSFPSRLNVEFVSATTRAELEFRVWERGSGVTYACGTGACASVAAGVREGWVNRHVVGHLQGGDLEIEIQDDGRVMMTGEAVEVLEGEFHLPKSAL